MTTEQIRSPFLIFENAVAPSLCEQIVDSVEFTQLDVDRHNRIIETHKVSKLATEVIDDFMIDHQQQIVDHYQRNIAFVDQARMMWANKQVVHKQAWCDNSARIQDKWLRVHNRDLTVLLFCSDYNDKPPFDSDFEVYGGKMEFPSHGFGFNPSRGTVIVYPCDPHFTHVFSQVHEGDLFISKSFLTTDPPLLYTPKDFPGTWKQWLEQVA